MRYTVVKENGCTTWHKEGTEELHRENGPAIEYSDGSKTWYINGKRHRENGPAVELSNGNKTWWINGELHREDGPAVEYSSGSKSWWVNGKLHREDGPAIEYNYDYKYWYLEGRQYTEEEFNKKLNSYKSSCSGKIVEIDGKKYKLTEV